jgi:hypothetical protein
VAEKPDLGLLIGVGKPEAVEETEAPEDGKVLAVRAFMDALKADDEQAVLDALLNVIDNLDQDEEPTEEAPMPPGPPKPPF